MRAEGSIDCPTLFELAHVLRMRDKTREEACDVYDWARTLLWSGPSFSGTHNPVALNPAIIFKGVTDS